MKKLQRVLTYFILPPSMKEQEHTFFFESVIIFLISLEC